MVEVRYFPLILVALLSACSSEPPAPAPVEETSSVEVTPPPESPDALPSLPDEVAGVWAAADSQGKPFDLVLFPNGQAVSTRVDTPSGARGQRGFWRRDGDAVVVMFERGWTDRLRAVSDGIVHETLTPGSAVRAMPSATSTARHLETPEAAFVGVWRLNREPDGSYLYVLLRSDRSAFSTIGGMTAGRWEPRDKGAWAIWPDGWNDLIEPGSQGWQKKAWVGAELQTLADLTEAERVGEKPFEITP
ncbi:MAG: hypothetical protein Fur0032_03770 [Terrimicrobiaceae bacterium]